MYNVTNNTVACLVVTERQVAEGEQQTEILSVNGKPSEYRSLNIHHTAVSGFVIRVFLKCISQSEHYLRGQKLQCLFLHCH